LPSIQSFIRDSMPEWKTRYPGVEGLNVAVMGCIVNGPGESKHADIGISLPGTGEQPTAPVFIDGKKAMTLRGPTSPPTFRRSSSITSSGASAPAPGAIASTWRTLRPRATISSASSSALARRSACAHGRR
jgi:hypothetical protein